MSCDDLDRLRAESPQTRSWSWSEEARRHLESCGRCAQLQALLDGPSPLDYPEALQERIEAAILPALRPVSPLPGVWRVAAALLLVSLAVIATANWWLGVAGWDARNGLQSSIDFSLLGISVVALAKLLADQMMPGSGYRAAGWVWLAAPAVALVAAVATLYGDEFKPDYVTLAVNCLKIGTACAVCLAPLFWLALRRGLSLHPIAHSATAGLLAGLVGVTVLEIYCPYLDRFHIFVSHIGAAVIAALAGAAFGWIREIKRTGRRSVVRR
ncbi:MAG TPA: NrsF family protein [Bryobacteraceae bacterium]|nr:NrsF family protein [Bryobacteraceae bacterium]